MKDKITKEKISKIFELSNSPLFQHKEFTSEGKVMKYGGKPNYHKIARELNISVSIVRTYILNLNQFNREYQKEHNQISKIKERRRLTTRKHHKWWDKIPKNKEKKKEYYKRNKEEILNKKKEWYKKKKAKIQEESQ